MKRDLQQQRGGREGDPGVHSNLELLQKDQQEMTVHKLEVTSLRGMRHVCYQREDQKSQEIMSDTLGRPDSGFPS